MSRFFCDTNCELPYEVFDGLNIELIKMPYTIGEEMFYYDLGRNTDSREFFDQMRKGAVPKTQALNEFDYEEYFRPVLAAGEDILYVSFSHQMSGTFQYMEAANAKLLEEFPERKITVIDTRGISMAAGTVVYYAAAAHNDGKSDEEVAAMVKALRDKLMCYFTVDNLVYLKRGGRLGSFAATMGTLLNIKPIIRLTEDGKLENFEKAKGRKASLKRLVQLVENSGIDTAYPMCMLQADTDGDAAYTVELLKEKFPDIKVNVQLVGPVIGSHCGPDTIGIIYIKK